MQAFWLLLTTWLACEGGELKGRARRVSIHHERAQSAWQPSRTQAQLLEFNELNALAQFLLAHSPMRSHSTVRIRHPTIAMLNSVVQRLEEGKRFGASFGAGLPKPSMTFGLDVRQDQAWEVTSKGDKQQRRAIPAMKEGLASQEEIDAIIAEFESRSKSGSDNTNAAIQVQDQVREKAQINADVEPHYIVLRRKKLEELLAMGNISYQLLDLAAPKAKGLALMWTKAIVDARTDGFSNGNEVWNNPRVEEVSNVLKFFTSMPTGAPIRGQIKVALSSKGSALAFVKKGESSLTISAIVADPKCLAYSEAAEAYLLQQIGQQGVDEQLSVVLHPVPYQIDGDDFYSRCGFFRDPDGSMRFRQPV